MSDKALKMVTCSGCDAKVFIPGDLPPLASEPCKRCGHAIMMPMQLRQFELRSKIALGGHGKVYRAFDQVLERLVAVKLMRKELESDPVALESFYREARACASLNHTNIIHIYAFDELDGQRYLVMELADRGSLDTRLDKQQRLSELAEIRTILGDKFALFTLQDFPIAPPVAEDANTFAGNATKKSVALAKWL